MQSSFRGKHMTFPNFGFSSMLLLLLMICIVLFSLLSLVISHSDYAASKEFAEETTNYYDAQVKAQEVLKDMDLICSTSYKQSLETDSLSDTYYFDSITQKAFAYDAYPISCTSSERVLTLSYQIPINTSQNLKVTIEISQPNQQASSFYQVKAWQVLTLTSTNGKDMP